jgi:hypothetical protein
MDRSALDSVFDQVGFCGIWCGSCAVGTSALMEIAGRYRDLCESHGLGHWGAGGFDYGAFLKGLDSISHLAGCPGCLKGGGREDCEIRLCATERGVRACSFCTDAHWCRHASVLDHMRTGAKAAGLLVAEARDEHDIPTGRRESELKSLWWWRALFGDGS